MSAAALTLASDQAATAAPNVPMLAEQSATSSSRWILALSAVLIGLCFLLTEHSRSVALHNDFSLSADDMQAQADGGNAIRRLCFLFVAGWGCVVACATRRVAPLRLSALLPVIGLLLAWCALSIVWSHAPGFTLRRLMVLGCLAMGAFGLARALSGADLCRLAILVCGVSLGLGILNELSLGTFRPWSGGYRFSGTLHPNTQGLYLTTLCTAAYALVRTGSPATSRARVVACWSVILVGLCFLVLTKSRTSTAGVFLSLGTLALLRSRIHPAALVGCFAAAWWLLGGALVCHLWQIDPLAELKQLLLMGRAEQAESLTGRIPIWTELAPFLTERFWMGWGYDSFWTPDHIDHVSTRVEWGVREAHSAYIETLLSVGVIGLGLLLTMTAVGLSQAAWRFRRQARPAAGVTAGLLVYGLLNSFTESGMTMPLFPTFLLGAMLWQTALEGTDESSVAGVNTSSGAD
jgi:exopolysaccharide production protein ExoQ